MYKQVGLVSVAMGIAYINIYNTFIFNKNPNIKEVNGLFFAIRQDFKS